MCPNLFRATVGHDRVQEGRKGCKSFTRDQKKCKARTLRRGGRELKSLLCDPGPELRLGGREERRAKILKRDGGKKKLWIGCTMGGGCTHVIHGRSRTTVDPRITTTPGRIASGFHGPGRHCLHQARSAVRCSAGRMKGLPPLCVVALRRSSTSWSPWSALFGRAFVLARRSERFPSVSLVHFCVLLVGRVLSFLGCWLFASYCLIVGSLLLSWSMIFCAHGFWLLVLVA